MAKYLQALGAVTELVIRYPPKARHYRKQMQLGCAFSDGLGDTAQVTATAASSASLASSGAKLGTMILPGIGTVIGAVVGVIAGVLLGKKKPVRPSAEQISQCNQTLSEYEALMAQYPGVPLGAALGEGNLKNVYVCFEMVRTGTTKDPRFLDGNWQLARDMAIEAVKKTFEAPAGTQIVLSTAGRRDIKGKAFRPVEVRWLNTEANSMQLIGAKLQAFVEQVCRAYQSQALCSRWADAVFSHLCMDIIEWAATTYLPQAQVPATPASPATPIPKVPPIADQPPPFAPSPSGPFVPVPGTAMPPNVAPPAVPAPQSLPPNATAEQIQHAVAQMTSLFMQTQQAQMMTSQQAASAATAAAQQWLAAQGVRAPPAAVADTAAAVVHAGSSNAPMLIALAGAGLLLAMPSRRASRARGPRRVRSRSRR